MEAVKHYDTDEIPLKHSLFSACSGFASWCWPGVGSVAYRQTLCAIHGNYELYFAGNRICCNTGVGLWAQRLLEGLFDGTLRSPAGRMRSCLCLLAIHDHGVCIWQQLLIRGALLDTVLILVVRTFAPISAKLW